MQPRPCISLLDVLRIPITLDAKFSKNINFYICRFAFKKKYQNLKNKITHSQVASNPIQQLKPQIVACMRASFTKTVR